MALNCPPGGKPYFSFAWVAFWIMLNPLYYVTPSKNSGRLHLGGAAGHARFISQAPMKASLVVTAPAKKNAHGL